MSNQAADRVGRFKRVLYWFGACPFFIVLSLGALCAGGELVQDSPELENRDGLLLSLGTELIVLRALAGIAFFALTFARDALARQREREQIKESDRLRNDLVVARAEVRQHLGSTVDTLVEELARLLAESPARQAALVRPYIKLALQCVRQMTGGPQLRASFFCYVGPDGIQNGPNGNTGHGLHHEASAGRQLAKGTSFLVASTNGAPVVEDLLERRWRIFRDVDKEPPAHWREGMTVDYKAFISVPVYDDMTPVGMLTIDSPDESDIDAGDQPVLLVVGRLIAIAHRYARH